MKSFTNPSSAQEPTPIESLDLRAFRSTPPPAMDFVLPGFLRGTVGALVSPGAAGKSFWALQASLMIAGGNDILGLPNLPQGDVVFLSAEDPEQALHHRIAAVEKTVFADRWEQIESRLAIFALCGRGGQLDNSSFVKAITRVAKGCRLIVVDTLRRFHSGDENSSTEMSRLLGVLEVLAAESGAAVLFLHHVSKGTALAGLGDEQQASRGSSVLTDNVRWQGYLVTMSRADAKEFKVETKARHCFVRFGISKQNYAPPFEDRWYQRGPGGVLLPIDADAIPERAANLYKNFQERPSRLPGIQPKGSRHVRL